MTEIPRCAELNLGSTRCDGFRGTDSIALDLRRHGTADKESRHEDNLGQETHLVILSNIFPKVMATPDRGATRQQVEKVWQAQGESHR